MPDMSEPQVPDEGGALAVIVMGEPAFEHRLCFDLETDTYTESTPQARRYTV